MKSIQRPWRVIRFALLIVVLASADGSALPGVRAAPHGQGGVPLDFGQQVTGTLDNETFREVYVFTARANQVVAISMTRLGGDLDPYLLLTDAQGTVLALSDDDGPGDDALIPFKHIPADGQYFVIATRFGQEHGSTAGDYALLLEQVGAGATGHTVLQYGDRALGRITAEAPLAFYFLRAQRGDVITITMRRTSGDLDPHLDLATADGIVLASNDDDPQAAGTLDAAIASHTIRETGIYLVVATRFGREAGKTTGSYVLGLTQIPPEQLGTDADSARLIDYGLALSGSIDDDVPARFFRFDGRRGDVITAALEAESGNLDPLLKLADANQLELAQDDNSGDDRDARIAAFTLPADGPYYLLATRRGEQEGQTKGTFTIRLSGRPGIVGGRALEIAYGATVSGLISDQTVAEEYIFFGQQGDVIRISMKRASGDLDALVTLLDGDRKQIAFDDDTGGNQNALIERFTLPRDDMFILVASRFEREKGTTSGAYMLTLELVRAAN